MTSRFVRAASPIAPVMKEPRASATQETQILYGHLAEVTSSDGPWLKVRGADGYEGWMHSGYVEPASGPSEWGWDADGDMSMGCSRRDERGTTNDMPLGALVKDAKCTSGRTLDGARRAEIFPAEAAAIVASATGLFQGTYYQWGGITPWGSDCSGMVQTVFALHGVKLLRDAWQQATQGVLISGGLAAIEAADLLFFSDREDGRISHVAMAISRTSLVHQSLGRGGHRVESLDEPDDYVRMLISNFRFARRIIGAGE
ncbi:MAG: SH3 domain-containing C40 family peptidase [Gemmatimonadaceae bacterium]